MSSTRLRTRASTLSLRLTTRSPPPLVQSRRYSQSETDSSGWHLPRVSTPHMGDSFAEDALLNIPPIPPLSYLEPDTPTSPSWDLPEEPLYTLIETCSFERTSIIVSDVQIHQPEGLGWRHSTVSTLTSLRRSSASTITCYRQSGTSTITPQRLSNDATKIPGSEDRKRKAKHPLSNASLRSCLVPTSKDRRTSLRMEPEHIGWGDLQSPVRLYFANAQGEVHSKDEQPVMKKRRGSRWLSRTPNSRSRMGTVQI